MLDDRCLHGVNPEFCSFCKPVILPKKEHTRFVDYDRCSEWCSEETLAYLRKHATVSAQVPPHAADVFESEMEGFGVSFEYGKHVYYMKNAVDREDKRWYSAMVVFPHHDDLEFNKSLNILDKGNQKSISSIAFVGYLLSQGFSFGKQKNLS